MIYQVDLLQAVKRVMQTLIKVCLKILTSLSHPKVSLIHYQSK